MPRTRRKKPSNYDRQRSQAYPALIEGLKPAPGLRDQWVYRQVEIWIEYIARNHPDVPRPCRCWLVRMCGVEGVAFAWEGFAVVQVFDTFNVLWSFGGDRPCRFPMRKTPPIVWAILARQGRHPS